MSSSISKSSASSDSTQLPSQRNENEEIKYSYNCRDFEIQFPNASPFLYANGLQTLKVVARISVEYQTYKRTRVNNTAPWGKWSLDVSQGVKSYSLSIQEMSTLTYCTPNNHSVLQNVKISSAPSPYTLGEWRPTLFSAPLHTPPSQSSAQSRDFYPQPSALPPFNYIDRYVSTTNMEAIYIVASIVVPGPISLSNEDMDAIETTVKVYSDSYTPTESAWFNMLTLQAHRPITLSPSDFNKTDIEIYHKKHESEFQIAWRVNFSLPENLEIYNPDKGNYRTCAVEYIYLGKESSGSQNANSKIFKMIRKCKHAQKTARILAHADIAAFNIGTRQPVYADFATFTNHCKDNHWSDPADWGAGSNIPLEKGFIALKYIWKQNLYNDENTINEQAVVKFTDNYGCSHEVHFGALADDVSKNFDINVVVTYCDNNTL